MCVKLPDRPGIAKSPCLRSQWLYDQYRNLARRGNRRNRSIREGATGHDNQPFLNLTEGEGAGRRIGQS